MIKINNPEKFVKRMKEIKPDFKVLEDWNGSQTKIKFLHKKCGTTFEATPNNMLKESYGGCPKCAIEKRKNGPYIKGLKKTIKDVKEKIKELYPNGEYTLLEKEYVNNKVPMKVRCNKCGYIFKISYVNLCKGKGCKYCNALNKYESKGTKIIEKYLEKYSLSYKREVTFKNCKLERNLYFDFKVYNPKNKKDFILLEYDGELHFRPFNENMDFYDEYKKQQKRDLVKNEFCKKHNIKLIRINYKEIKDIEKIIKNISDNYFS